MPYNSINELPASVKDNLPKHAQEIFKEAFNGSYSEYGEKRSLKIAWSAVKKSYHKNEKGDWVKK